MKDKAFTAGVVPGGLTSNQEIKILICYLLASIDESVAHAPLIGALTKEGLVNYFECADALGDLLHIGNIAMSNDRYTVTETGRNIADTLYSDLPLTVRERALKRTQEAVLLQKKSQQHHTMIRAVENGFIVRCFIDDNGSEIFAVELYAPSKYYAQNIQRNFVSCGEEIIRNLFEQLTADPED